jgi:hypothetical protein
LVWTTGQGEPTATSTPWEMDSGWRGNTFSLGF